MESETRPTVDLGDWSADNWGTIDDCVMRGLAWLIADGESFGLNIDNIDPGRLAIRHTERCVLAQAGGRTYQTVVERITGRAPYSGVANAWTEAHGFCLPMFSDEETWERLTDAWRTALAEHRAQATDA